MSNEEKIKLAFGKALKENRRSRNKTQESLAMDVGLDRTYISMLERGIYGQTLTAIVAISEGLNMTTAELISDFDQNYKK